MHTHAETAMKTQGDAFNESGKQRLENFAEIQFNSE